MKSILNRNRPMVILLGNSFTLLILAAALALSFVNRVHAQDFITLYDFSGHDPVGRSGAGGLVVSAGKLYGTTQYGGSSNGTVFSVNVDGTGFTNLHSFTPLINGTNGDGATPLGDLILSGDILYGTTFEGGLFNRGVIFSINTDGSGFSTVYTFQFADGGTSLAGLVISGNTLYGTTGVEGSIGGGYVFSVNTDGTAFNILHVFGGSGAGTDGSIPKTLLLLDNTLYGVTARGGEYNNGTVFAISSDGTDFRSLYSFSAGNYDSLGYITNRDGALPMGALISSSNTLYGTTSQGGGNGVGVLFSVNTDGTGFTNFYTFAQGHYFNGRIANSDGVSPYAGLILSSQTLYGTAFEGGAFGAGTVFQINTDGSGFKALHSFGANIDGVLPRAPVVLAGNTLYGTTSSGGSSRDGTIFSISLPGPQLTISPDGANVVLTWPANATGFTLQSATNLVSPAIWTTVSPGPVLVNGQNTVTNPVSGGQQFYRLAQ
jgi:uncharacterized repeat protein (TIGR03803 family)